MCHSEPLHFTQLIHTKRRRGPCSKKFENSPSPHRVAKSVALATRPTRHRVYSRSSTCVHECMCANCRQSARRIRSEREGKAKRTRRYLTFGGCLQRDAQRGLLRCRHSRTRKRQVLFPRLSSLDTFPRFLQQRAHARTHPRACFEITQRKRAGTSLQYPFTSACAALYDEATLRARPTHCPVK